MSAAVSLALCTAVWAAELDSQPITWQNVFCRVAHRYLEKDLQGNGLRGLRTTLLKSMRELDGEASERREAAALRPKLLALKGAINLEIGDKSKARADFERAAKHDATLFVCLNNGGALNFEAQNYVRAVDLFADAAESLMNGSEVARLKPFCDATLRRLDGRTCFETIVDNLAEGLQAYELDQRQSRRRSLPRKVARAKQQLDRLESAMAQDKAPLCRWGTLWVTEHEFRRRRWACDGKDRQIRQAESEMGRLTQSLARARDEARRYRDYARREPRLWRKEHHKQQRINAETRARRFDEQLEAQWAKLKDLQAERGRLGPVFAGTCGFLDLEDDPSFFYEVISSQANVAPPKRAWRELREGMTTEEVRQLLGEPERIAIRRGKTLWLYGDYGEVRFAGDTISAEGWDEPSDVMAKVQAWRQLRVGMTAREVCELLGEPERIMVSKGAARFRQGVAHWRYSDSGEVRYDRHTMRVEGWDEPGGPSRIERRPLR